MPTKLDGPSPVPVSLSTTIGAPPAQLTSKLDASTAGAPFGSATADDIIAQIHRKPNQSQFKLSWCARKSSMNLRIANWHSNTHCTHPEQPQNGKFTNRRKIVISNQLILNHTIATVRQRMNGITNAMDGRHLTAVHRCSFIFRPHWIYIISLIVLVFNGFCC